VKLKRYEGNPILSPNPSNAWEDLAVFNPEYNMGHKPGCGIRVAVFEGNLDELATTEPRDPAEADKPLR
jgi:hypothetical protein